MSALSGERQQTLRLAAMSRRRLEYAYRTRAGELLSGVLEPFAIGVHKNTIYVLARLVPSQRAEADGTAQRPSWVSWPAHRFVDAGLTRDEFVVPAGFKLDDHFDGWGIISGNVRERVVVEFDAELAPLIAERRWHASQRLETLRGGGVRLTFEVANTSEVIAWILSYGSHATVVEPASLRDEILAEHFKAIDRMLTRMPTLPAKGWQDEGLRVFDDEQLHEMSSAVANDNKATADASKGGDDDDDEPDLDCDRKVAARAGPRANRNMRRMRWRH